jgi:hypothetical protein
MTRDAARAYVKGWVETSRLLDAIRWQELAGLDATKAREVSDALIRAALAVPLPETRRSSSGLVHLQRLLDRQRL